MIPDMPPMRLWAPRLTALLLLTAMGMAHAESVDEAALRNAARNADLGKVERLLAKGTDPNVPGHDGWTSVFHAADLVNVAILDALLEAGGNPNARDSQNRTPLHLAPQYFSNHAFESDSQAAIRLLLQHGANPNLADLEGRSPLHVVVQEHRGSASVDDLLRAGASPNRVDDQGDTPLLLAVGPYSPFSADVVEALVQGGANVDVVGNRRETPLQQFVRLGPNDGSIVWDPDGCRSRPGREVSLWRSSSAHRDPRRRPFRKGQCCPGAA